MREARTNHSVLQIFSAYLLAELLSYGLLGSATGVDHLDSCKTRSHFVTTHSDYLKLDEAL